MSFENNLKDLFLCFPTKNEEEKEDDPEERAKKEDGGGEEEQFDTHRRNLDRNLLFSWLPNVTDKNSQSQILRLLSTSVKNVFS